MAIVGMLGEKRQLPVGGKIRLGRRDEQGRPVRCEYFVAPKAVQEATSPVTGEPYGPKPAQLDILFPDDDLEVIFPHYLRKYEPGAGVVCRSDGRKARRFNKEERTWQVGPCAFKECPDYQKGLCKAHGRLHFLIPTTQQTECWGLEVSSLNSIKALLGDLRYIRQLTGGRLRGVPMQLYREPRKAQVRGNQYTYYIVRLRYAGDFASALQRLCGFEPVEQATGGPVPDKTLPAPRTSDELGLLKTALQEGDLSPTAVGQVLFTRYGVETLDELAAPQLEDLQAWLESQARGETPEQLSAYIAGAFHSKRPQPRQARPG